MRTEQWINSRQLATHLEFEDQDCPECGAVHNYTIEIFPENELDLIFEVLCASCQEPFTIVEPEDPDADYQ